MNPRVEARLEKVKRISRSMKRACYWLMGLVLLMAALTVLARLTLPGSPSCAVQGVQAPWCGELSSQALTFLLVALIGGVALALTGLYRLARLFGNYSRGEIFTRGSVREICWLSYVAVAYVVFQGALFVAMLSLNAGGANDWPSELRFDLPIGPALVATLLTLLAWIMDVGAELREENELTV
jgi:hypothetical protein